MAEWKIREDFRIGSMLGDSSNSFTSRNLVAALSPAGDIYVIDYGADQIYSYTGSGEFKRVIGRAGSGPGEFDGPTGLAWDGAGRMWVADARNRRYTLFDDSGAVLATFPREVTGLKRVPHSLYVDRSGLVIDELAAQGEFYYPRISMEGVTLDTVARHPIPPLLAAFAGRVVSRSMEAMRFVGNHYISRPRSVLAPDGTVWTAETGEPRLARLDSDGDTFRIGPVVRIAATSG